MISVDGALGGVWWRLVLLLLVHDVCSLRFWLCMIVLGEALACARWVLMVLLVVYNRAW